MLKTAEIRLIARRAKAAMTADERRLCSETLSRRLLNLPTIQQARTLLLYYPLPDEVDIRPVIETLCRDTTKTVLLPRVVSDTAMQPVRYNAGDNLTTGAYGIKEPTGEVFTDYDTIDTAVVPGMAFDPQGHRIGRGRGYYDRLLPLLHNAHRIGVAFPCQLFTNLPAQNCDVPMNEILC